MSNIAQTSYLPPQALDLEEAVLGAILLERDALPIVLEILTKDSFYSEDFQIVYGAIVEMVDSNTPVDIRTLTNHLNTKGITTLGGNNAAYFITMLTDKVASTAHIETHARIIKEKAMARGIIDMCSHALKAAYSNKDIFDVVGILEKGLTNVSSGLIKKPVRHIGDFVTDVIEDQRKPRKEGLQGITSSLHELDQVTGGWMPSDLIIVAGRPGMGKSGAALVFAGASAETGNPVAIFTLEMEGKQNAIRFISQKTGIGIKNIRHHKLSENQKNEMESKSIPLSNLPIYIDDSSELSIRDLKSKCLKLKREKGIKMVIIDYLQLMNDGGKSKNNREQEVSNISKGLKIMAKELDLPVIALSQLNRSVEKSGKKHSRPQLSDLRDSGALEQDADMVIFIYRPEYYDKDAVDENSNSLKGVAEFIVAKQRNGDTDKVMTKFTSYTTNFSNLTEPVEEVEAAPF